MMKIGAENQKKAIAAGALFLVAIIMFVHMFWGGSSGSAPSGPATANAANPQARPAGRRTPPNRKGGTRNAEKSGPLTPNLDPRLHLDLLADSENVEYKGNGRNLFDAASMPDIPVAVAPAMPKQPDIPQTPVAATPPPPPPIPLKFYGFTSSGGMKQVFLMQNDDVFVAKEGDIVQRRYKIVKINNNNVEVLDVLSNNKQSIPLTAG